MLGTRQIGRTQTLLSGSLQSTKEAFNKFNAPPLTYMGMENLTLLPIQAQSCTLEYSKTLQLAIKNKQANKQKTQRTQLFQTQLFQKLALMGNLLY